MFFNKLRFRTIATRIAFESNILLDRPMVCFFMTVFFGGMSHFVFYLLLRNSESLL